MPASGSLRLSSINYAPTSGSKTIKSVSYGWIRSPITASLRSPRITDLRITRKGDTMEIVPVRPLEPGEYFLTFGFSHIGYDFGVSK